jgi:hypothetical protein
MTVIINGTDNAVGNPAVQGGTGGTTTGVYYPSANAIALVTNGANALTISSTQAATFANNVSITGTLTLTTALPVDQGGTGGTTVNAASTNLGIIGVGQTWQDVSGSRAVGTTYTNSTGKPIMVAVTYTCSSANTVQGLTISGASVYAAAIQALANYASGFSLMVPNGATYVILTNGGTLTLVTWYELR